jgi:hypothetical protein
MTEIFFDRNDDWCFFFKFMLVIFSEKKTRKWRMIRLTFIYEYFLTFLWYTVKNVIIHHSWHKIFISTFFFRTSNNLLENKSLVCVFYLNSPGVAKETLKKILFFSALTLKQKYVNTFMHICWPIFSILHSLRWLQTLNLYHCSPCLVYFRKIRFDDSNNAKRKFQVEKKTPLYLFNWNARHIIAQTI